MKTRCIGKVLVLSDGEVYNIFKPIRCDTKEEVIGMVTNVIDNTKIFKGAVIGITEETGVEFEGDEFTKEKKYLEFVGDLNQEEMDLLQEKYFESLVV